MSITASTRCSESLLNNLSEEMHEKIIQWEGHFVSLRPCEYCEEIKKVQICSGCMKAFYCGVECQKLDRKAHKKQCKQWKKEREEASTFWRLKVEKIRLACDEKKMLVKLLNFYREKKLDIINQQILYEKLYKTFERYLFEDILQKEKLLDQVKKCIWSAQKIEKGCSDLIEYYLEVKKINLRIDVASKKKQMEKAQRLTDDKEARVQSEKSLEQNIANAEREKEQDYQELLEIIKNTDDTEGKLTGLRQELSERIPSLKN